MSNLTKYELLQHRHLSLLRALEAAGVRATSNHKGEWMVHTTESICREFKVDAHPGDIKMPEGYEFNKDRPAYDPAITLQQFLDVGWTIDTLKSQAIIVPVGEPYSDEAALEHDAKMCRYRIAMDATGKHVIYYEDLAEMPVRKVEMTPLLRGLLAALRHAIVPPSPAKVD